MAVDKKKQKIALGVFQENAHVNQVWITSDLQAFISEDKAIYHHKKINDENEPELFYREGSKDENLNQDDYKAMFFVKQEQIDQLASEKKILEGLVKDLDKHNQELTSDMEVLGKVIIEKDTEIESLKARIAELESVKPETNKDEGNTTKKGK
ncbi:MAG: hypothetical protein KIG88_11725 [Weeksellaceae bacterium]|nr:hypothetical protein [Weeksellaceae bacterium]